MSKIHSESFGLRYDIQKKNTVKTSSRLHATLLLSDSFLDKSFNFLYFKDTDMLSIYF